MALYNLRSNNGDDSEDDWGPLPSNINIITKDQGTFSILLIDLLKK